MTPNVEILVRDWKQPLNGADVAKAIRKVEVAAGSCIMNDGDFITGSDSIITFIGPPGDYDYTMGEELMMAAQCADGINWDGKAFWFNIEGQWLDIRSALAHAGE
jgi:hypothetical protein